MIKWYGLFLAGLLLLSGCASSHSPLSRDMVGRHSAVSDQMDVQEPTAADMERMLIWNADLELEVKSISNTVERAADVVKKFEGYIENKSFRKDVYARLRLRIPSKALTGTMGELEKLGEVSRRNLSSKDVTEEYIDVESRLKNKKVLRDRLQLLLDKADAVKDVLAIEKELNRVQSDIDSMERRIRSLSGKVDYATIDLELTRKTVYGPIGLMFKWTGSLLSKLFVIK